MKQGEAKVRMHREKEKKELIQGGKGELLKKQTSMRRRGRGLSGKGKRGAFRSGETGTLAKEKGPEQSAELSQKQQKMNVQQSSQTSEEKTRQKATCKSRGGEGENSAKFPART